MTYKITIKVDSWSIGIILFEMLVGRRPFIDANEFNLVQKILQDDVP